MNIGCKPIELKRHKLEICYFSRKWWTMTSLMTSSWRHSIGFVSTHITSTLPSLVKIGWKTVKLSCSQAQGPILPEMTSLWRHWWRHHEKINRILPYPTRNNSVRFHQDRIRFGRVFVFTSSGGDFTGNDVTDDVIITKINRVLPYPTRNNPVKFHQDRIRFSRVIVFTRKCLQTTDIMMTIPLVLPRGKNASYG